jgi:adenylate cyclase
MSVLPTLRRGLIYLLPLALLVIAVGARIAASDQLERLSLFCFDLYQEAAPRQAGDAPISIVDIDDKSLNKLGQWPWPRSVVAQLVDRLREAGAAVVAFDIDFAEPDRTSPKSLLPLLVQNGVGAAETENLRAAVPDPDRRLAEAIGALPVVTGFILTDHGDARPPAPKAGFAFVGDDPLGHVDRFPAAVVNLPGLEEAAAGNGFLNQFGRLGSRSPPGPARTAARRQALSRARRRDAAACPRGAQLCRPSSGSE